MSERPWSSSLSAYLDGELPPAEKEAVERALAKDKQLARHLNELKTLTSLLQSLPRVSAPAATIRNLLKRIVRSDRSLVDAYFDQELDSRERRIVEKYLLPRPKAKKALEETKQTHGALEALPRMRAPEDSQARLLASLANDEILADLPSSDAIVNTSKPPSKRRPYHELLSAYLDNELPSNLVPTIERKLRESANARRVLGELKSLRSMLHSMPREAAPPETLGRVLRKLKGQTTAPANREAVANTAPLRWVAEQNPTAQRHVRGGAKVQWLAGIAIAAAVAVGVVLLLPSLWQGNAPVRVADTSSRPAPPLAPAESSYAKRDKTPAELPEDRDSEQSVPHEPQWTELAENQDLPIEGLAGLSLAELAKLDGGNIRLWSDNTANALDRLWIVLHDNEASIRTNESTQEADSQGEQTTIVASISPVQLAEILRDLIYAEKNRQLFARVDVEDDVPTEEAGGAEKPTHQLVARIETANPIAMPLPSSNVPNNKDSGPLFPSKVQTTKPAEPAPEVVKRPVADKPLPSRITVRFVLQTK